jgi:histidinol-phosphate phosphatase family protein
MIHFDKNWTLFLDRDGVINHRIPNDYVKQWSEFHFLPEAILAIVKLSKIFNHIVVVTNQAGISKGLMTENQLFNIHQNMISAIKKAGGHIDKVYFAPDHPKMPTNMRKPNIGMAEQAKLDFPIIKFENSVMVGDSISDIQFGKNAGMITVFIEGKGEAPSVVKPDPDMCFNRLIDFAEFVYSTE